MKNVNWRVILLIGLMVLAAIVMLSCKKENNANPSGVIINLPEEYMDMSYNTPIRGKYENNIVHIEYVHEGVRTKIEPEVIIELLDQQNVAISNGITTDTIHFSEINRWIIINNE